MKRKINPKVFLLFACSTFLMAAPSHAVFHLWDINELYSNSDGTIQYIELFTASNSQQFLENHDIVASQGGAMNTFIFPGNSPSPTGNRHLLIATAGFAALPGAVTPDFTLPDGFLFTPNGTVNFAENTDVQTYESIPTDGVLSLHYPGGTVAANSPTNFNGDLGSIDASGGIPTPTPTPMVEDPTATPSATHSEVPTSTNTPVPTETATSTQPVPTQTPTHTPATDESTATPTSTEVLPGETATPSFTRSADLDGMDGVDPKDLFIFILEWMKQSE